MPPSLGKAYAISVSVNENSAASGVSPSGPPVAHVSVVERAERRIRFFVGRTDEARDRGVATVGADHDARARLGSVGEPDAGDARVLHHQGINGDAAAHFDAGRRRMVEEHSVERFPSNRKAISDLARVLRRMFFSLALEVHPLSNQLRGAERQHVVERADPIENTDESRSAEEVRRDRATREARAVDEQNPMTCIRQ
jgi:hypothetical protein